MSQNNKPTVFISSTFIDNEERRKVVEDAILRAEMMPVGMEHFTASVHPTVEECKKQVRNCDIYLGIISHRYGWIPKGYSISITEIEYDAANAASLPRLMFHIDESVPVDIERELDPEPERWKNQKLLAAFRLKFCEDQMSVPFTDATLGIKVFHALTRWRMENPQTEADYSSLTSPGLVRKVLDWYLPFIHKKLTLSGTFSQPKEYRDLNNYLGEQRNLIERKIAEGTYLPLREDKNVGEPYIPLHARKVPKTGAGTQKDPFLRPIARVIRQIQGKIDGGDGAVAEISAANRSTKPVRNVVKFLLKSKEPLVLLGDPGAGKTMTLLEALHLLVCSEERRVFPIIPIFVRLGEFHIRSKEVSPAQVLAHVKQSSSPLIKPWFNALFVSA